MKTTASNCLVVAGSGLMVYGVSLLSVPAAFVVAGAALLRIGISIARGK